MKLKLNPCGACRSRAFWWRVKKVFCGECANCGRLGPEQPTAGKAVRAWNEENPLIKPVFGKTNSPDCPPIVWHGNEPKRKPGVAVSEENPRREK